MTQSWENAIHQMLVEAIRAGIHGEDAIKLVALATLRASNECPEWGQARLRLATKSPLVGQLAATLVNGTPIERMVI